MADSKNVGMVRNTSGSAVKANTDGTYSWRIWAVEEPILGYVFSFHSARMQNGLQNRFGTINSNDSER